MPSYSSAAREAISERPSWMRRLLTLRLPSGGSTIMIAAVSTHGNNIAQAVKSSTVPAELLRTPLARSSQNLPSTHSGE